MEYKIQSLMLALLKNEICGAVLSEEHKKSIDEQMLKQLYALSAKHDLAHVVGSCLQKNGLLGAVPIKKAFDKQVMLAVYRDEWMDYEIEALSQLFESEGIDFILLKGSVIKNYYPEKWQRTNCDVDVLVKENELERITELLQEKLNYSKKGRTSHDVSFSTPSGVSIEVHFDLVEGDMHPEGKNLVEKVWKSARPYAGFEHRMAMSDENEYCYHLTHMAKHFRDGGCGVRPFIDLWLMCDRKAYDISLRNKMIEDAGLTKFETAVQEVVKAWFGDGEHTVVSVCVEEYVLNGGVYGNFENRVYSQQSRQGGKFKYLWKRTFMPMDSLKQRYPKVKKYPILAPIYQFERMFTMIKEGRAGRALREMRVNAKMSKEKIKSGADLIDRLGL